MNTNYDMENLYRNLWSADNTILGIANDDLVVKTIYDPSPVGYKVPASNVLRLPKPIHPLLQAYPVHSIRDGIFTAMIIKQDQLFSFRHPAVAGITHSMRLIHSNLKVAIGRLSRIRFDSDGHCTSRLSQWIH